MTTSETTVRQSHNSSNSSSSSIIKLEFHQNQGKMTTNNNNDQASKYLNNSSSSNCVTPNSSPGNKKHQPKTLDNDNDFARPESAENTEELGKHHVGPVMGIFFKVWSLVKVTKMRNQKLRRQASEDANQFQYISGEQLHRHDQHQNQRLALLGAERGNFRRAGSQPAPSNRKPLLQVGASTSSATNSTSSGVSSAASSTLAASGGSPTSGTGVRRHLSAYSLRRSAAAGAPEVPQTARGSALGVSGGGGGGARGWTARVRRSATALQSGKEQRLIVGQPERPHGLLHANQGVETAPPAESIATNEREHEEEEAEEEEEDNGDTNDEPDEEDSNDIYSTPNDSIQSVPMGGNYSIARPTLYSTTAIEEAGQQQQACYPITKSFSTTSFNQLLSRQRQQASSCSGAKFEPIGEQQRAPVAADNQNGSKQPNSKRMRSSSRFFISSSSSEDSNSARQQNQQQLQHPQPQQLQLEQLNQELPLKHGVHYHAPVLRPDSLLFGQPTLAPQLLTPSAMLCTPLGAGAMSPLDCALVSAGYRKSPSFFELARQQRFSSKYPSSYGAVCAPITATDANSPKAAAVLVGPPQAVAPSHEARGSQQWRKQQLIPNSVSLNDCKLASQIGRRCSNDGQWDSRASSPSQIYNGSEYKLAKMLLDFNSNPNAKDSSGSTALMHAVLSDNLPAIKCLLEHQVDPNDTNDAGLSALDLICSKPATSDRLEILKMLIDKQANFDRTREEDGTRLLDRLISEHSNKLNSLNKLPFIDCLLQNGAKLGSSTWLAANGKHDIQLRLLKKLCQDGYFLYKKSSIEAAVFRFEYALKRIAELEQQLASFHPSRGSVFGQTGDLLTPFTARQLKYQTYLGLSRCERKRKFYKRALEFAHMAILVDSTAYEGYYSKAHILKDLGELDESLQAIEQTFKLVDKSTEAIRMELKELQQQEEALILDGCFSGFDAKRSNWIRASRNEMNGNLSYMEEAKRHTSILRDEILNDKLLRGRAKDQTFSTTNNSSIAT